MATLEDKILGEKLHYYCSSSSEDEVNDSGDSGNEEESSVKKKNSTERESSDVASGFEYSKWDGTSSNTGPKGVLGDWQRFKQIESEKRLEQEKERLELIKKLSLTCRSALDEEKDELRNSDPELAELMNDDFLLDYQKQRMLEMINRADKLRFGKLYRLSNADEFLEAVDSENESVTIVVHVYEDGIEGCETMNGCLINLAGEYPSIKFCAIRASAANMSRHFKKEGVPAILVYKKGQVIGNFVRITDNLGSDFYSSDVEIFLTEHGMINDKKCIPNLLVDGSKNDRDSDSD